VLQSYGRPKGSARRHLKVSARLAVGLYRATLVADSKNHRVLMLSQSLSLIREVVLGMRDPCRIWFDDDGTRWNSAIVYDIQLYGR